MRDEDLSANHSIPPSFHTAIYRNYQRQHEPVSTNTAAFHRFSSEKRDAGKYHYMYAPLEQQLLQEANYRMNFQKKSWRDFTLEQGK